MATVHVLRVFYDLKAQRRRQQGDVFTATDERAREIESKVPQHVAVIYEQPKPQAEVEAPAEVIDYSKLSKTALAALCDERGIAYPKSASKAKLIGLLGGE